MPKGSWSSQNAGSSSAQLLGSIAAGALPKILRISTAMHWLSFDWPPSGLCCESSVILDKLLGQTLRNKAANKLFTPPGAITTATLSPGSVDGSGYRGPDPSTALSPARASKALTQYGSIDLGSSASPAIR